MEQEMIAISALWLRRIGDDVEVLIETDGEWRKVMTEYVDASFSHITEARGMQKILKVVSPETFEVVEEKR